ncbi:MAG: translation elongation factor Ts [Phycisphaerales bacterium]
MAEISAKDVMKLRQKTGLGMMDCKNALIENGGDPVKAEAWLREKRKGKMDARTERATAEGRIGIGIDGGKASIVEVRTETDFTARNDEFASMVADVVKESLGQPAGALNPTAAMTKRIDDLRIKTGENVNFARGEKLEGGAFGSYIHHDNKRGALIQIEGSADEDTLRSVCQHIVAHVPPPIAVDENDMPSDQINAVRAEAEAEAQNSGKPAEIAAKIAEGKVRKFLEVNTLLEQKFIRDDSKTVREILPKTVKVTRFVRYTVGQEEAE